MVSHQWHKKTPPFNRDLIPLPSKIKSQDHRLFFRNIFYRWCQRWNVQSVGPKERFFSSIETNNKQKITFFLNPFTCKPRTALEPQWFYIYIIYRTGRGGCDNQSDDALFSQTKTCLVFATLKRSLKEEHSLEKSFVVFFFVLKVFECSRGLAEHVSL